MFQDLECTLPINAQGATFTTYRDIVCALVTNANDANIYGRIIDCTLPITTYFVTAIKNDSHGIRMYVNINGVNVSAYVVGEIKINHTKNSISTFELSLNNPAYSPLNADTVRDSNLVYINATVNRQSKRIFTGYIDNVDVEYGLDNFRISVKGRDKTKLLLDKRMSLISVQEDAGQNRGEMIEYIAAQASVNAYSQPGSYTRIDHSFHDQTLLDMITKEMVIDSMWWRPDEYGEMYVRYSNWPVAHWSYDEDKIIRTGLHTDSNGIINKVKVCGYTYATMTEVDVEAGEDPADSPGGEYLVPLAEPEDEILFSYYNFFAADDVIAFNYWVSNSGNYVQLKQRSDKTVTLYSAGGGAAVTWHKYSLLFQATGYTNLKLSYRIAGELKIFKANIDFNGQAVTYFDIYRKIEAGVEAEGTVSFEVTGREKDYQPPPTPEDYEDAPVSAIVDNEEVAKPTYEYSYDQVNAEVTDPTSIAIFGERKPNSEGTVDFPLAENEDQCEGIAKNIIRESHRMRFQPDFEVPFNPLIKVGDSLSISDKKVGYSGSWTIEDMLHTIGVSPDGQIKARTELRCVYYA